MMTSELVAELVDNLTIIGMFNGNCVSSCKEAHGMGRLPRQCLDSEGLASVKTTHTTYIYSIRPPKVGQNKTIEVPKRKSAL
jgi:hypothetical protein